MSFFKKLRGTMEAIFRIGKNGNQIKFGDSAAYGSDTLEIRDATDAGFAKLRGADPVDNQDFLTLAYFNANNAAANGVTAVELTGLAATTTSSLSIPANAKVVNCLLKIGGTAFNSGVLIDVALTGGSSLMGTGDNDAEDADDLFSVEQLTDVGGAAKTLTVTFSGSAVTQGTCDVVVEYVTPTDIS